MFQIDNEIVKKIAVGHVKHMLELRKVAEPEKVAEAVLASATLDHMTQQVTIKLPTGQAVPIEQYIERNFGQVQGEGQQVDRGINIDASIPSTCEIDPARALQDGDYFAMLEAQAPDRLAEALRKYQEGQSAFKVAII